MDLTDLAAQTEIAVQWPSPSPLSCKDMVCSKQNDLKGNLTSACPIKVICNHLHCEFAFKIP